MLILYVLLYFITAFGGYLIGRWGHYYLNVWLKNPKWAPHHWIYGLALMAAGIFFYREFIGLLAISFGLGHFISDLKDFLKLKFVGPDEEGEKKFWGID